jgi:hypothetical protein
MDCQILEMRLSLIWTETILDLLKKTPPADAPLKTLGRRATYEVLFEQLLGGGTPSIPYLHPPWPKARGQLYWQRYLESSELATLKSSAAWHGLVPLRTTLPATVKPAQWLAKVPAAVEINVNPEAFFYPHGSAFVVTVIARLKKEPPTLPLFDAVDLALRIRRDKFSVKWDGSGSFFAGAQWGNVASEMTLDQLAERALAAIRVSAFGSAAAAPPVIDPFTIFTTVRGRGVDPGQPVDDEMRRALEAVSRWSPSWRYDPLPDLTDRKIDIKTSPPSHVLYGRAKARAVWFPERFTHLDIPRSLACYHRNLTLNSMQVESMCGLAASVAALLGNDQLDSESLRDCARQAGGALGRLYGGGGVYKKSYRSMSPRVQIEQNGFVPDINTVRKVLGVGGDLA